MKIVIDCFFFVFDTRNTDLRWHGSTYSMVLYIYNQLQKHFQEHSKGIGMVSIDVYDSDNDSLC